MSNFTGGVQVYNDDLRYCERERGGLEHPPHTYAYAFLDETIQWRAGRYACHGLTADESGHPFPDRPKRESAIDLLIQALGDRPVRFWMCAKPGHGTSLGGPGRETVRWIDGVGHCTTPGCGRTSLDPQPELDDRFSDAGEPEVKG